MCVSKTDFCFCYAKKPFYKGLCRRSSNSTHKNTPLWGQSPNVEYFVVCRSIYLLNIFASINEFCMQYNTGRIQKQGLELILEG